MARTGTTDVLIVGAGPVGLSAAAELRRHGVSCRLVDRLPARLPYAKAVGIQPRTLELWDRMGLVRAVLEAAVPMRGQLTYVDGREAARIDLVLPPEVPYGFAALPQYETERLLEEYLAGLGTAIERGTELISFGQDPDGVTAELRTASGAAEELRVRYLIGCDGAHSIVRKTLGLSFEGGAFPATYMLGDVVAESDWELPEGYALRSEHRAADGSTDDVLVCIPLPGAGRYRMSMMVPPELTAPATASDGVAHGLDGGQGPDLSHLQAVVDRLAPRPTRLSGLRWSSVFRISHRIVDRYGEGRVFVAGDAAHIHPPTGAQGMNTGVQDAVNLGWKLALVVRGEAGPGLLGSYDAERRPVGEEVVGRTVRHSTQGFETDPDDPRTLLLREAQLLVGYRNGPLSGVPYGPVGAPQPGDRAPDCTGLTTPIAVHPFRLLDVLRGHPGHVVLLYGPEGAELAAAATEASACGGLLPLTVLAVLPEETAEETPEETADGTTGTAGAAEADATGSTPPSPPPDLGVPAYRDAAGEFARLYLPDGGTGFVVRPDGQLAARFPLGGTAAALSGCLRALSVPLGNPSAAV